MEKKTHKLLYFEICRSYHLHINLKTRFREKIYIYKKMTSTFLQNLPSNPRGGRGSTEEFPVSGADLFDRIFRRFPQRKLKESISLHFCSTFDFLGRRIFYCCCLHTQFCVHVLVCVCARTEMFVYLCKYVCVCKFFCMRFCIFVYACVYLFKLLCLCTYVCIYSRICMCSARPWTIV